MSTLVVTIIVIFAIVRFALDARKILKEHAKMKAQDAADAKRWANSSHPYIIAYNKLHKVTR